MRTKVFSSTSNFFSLPTLPSFQPWVIAVGVIIFSSVLEYAGLTQWVRASVEVSTAPVRQAGVQTVHVVRQPLEFTRIAMLKYTYVLDLELRYAEAAAQLTELEHLRRENQELRSTLEQEKATPSADAAGRRRRFGSIVSYARPTIALGKIDGLHGGEVVRVSGVFIGKVTVVSDHQAQLRLLHTSAVNDPILGQIDSGVSGIITGNGNEVIMKEVPIETVVQIGQRVETIGQFGIESGLYIGRVKQVIREEGAPTQTVVIDQGVSFFRSTLVEVLQ